MQRLGVLRDSPAPAVLPLGTTLNQTPDEEQELEQTPDEVFATAVLFEMALGVLALILGWTIGPDARKLVPELSSATMWPIFSGLLYGCLAAIPMYIFIEGVRRIPWEPVRELERLGEDGTFQTLLRLTKAELILISICAGVGEELLFRGWLMGFLASGFSAETPTMIQMGGALIASSIAFGLVHPITKLYIVLAALMGVYFGLLLIWSGNLLVPIAAHAAYDAAQLILASRKSETPETA